MRVSPTFFAMNVTSLRSNLTLLTLFSLGYLISGVMI